MSRNDLANAPDLSFAVLLQRLGLMTALASVLVLGVVSGLPHVRGAAASGQAEQVWSW